VLLKTHYLLEIKMNERDYREGRVRVTDKIRSTLANLVIRENDFAKKKKQPAKWYREQVAKELELKDKDNPSLRSYEEALKPIRRLLQAKNPWDKPWSIGSSIECGISADMIPVLIKMQQIGQKIRREITIRQARWFARLYPSVEKVTKKQNIALVFIQLSMYNNVKLDSELASLLIKLYKLIESEKEQSNQLVGLAWLALIGVQYARQEQIGELTGDTPSNTSELDNLYFIQGDFSAEALFDGFWLVYTTPEQKRQRADYIANFKGSSAEELESTFGKLTPAQLDLANDVLRVFLSGAVSGREWKEQHPKEWEELMKLWEAKEHERLNNQEV